LCATRLLHDRLAVSARARDVVAARDRCAALLAVGRAHRRRRASAKTTPAGSPSARTASARAAATCALGRAGQNDAGQARAAVGAHAAAARGGHATRTIANIRRGSARVCDARKVAAVGAARAGLAGEARVGLRAVDRRDQTARDAQDVLLARVLLQDVARAAVCVGVALHGLQSTDPTSRRAGVAGVAPTDGTSRCFGAGDVGPGAVGPRRGPAAVGIFTANLARRVAAARRLADENTGRAVREAPTAATRAATHRERASRVARAARAELARAQALARAGSRRHAAKTERCPGCLVAEAGTAIEIVRTNVAALRAEGGRAGAEAALAILRAAIRVARAGVAGRLAPGAKRGTRTARALSTAALAIDGARRCVRLALTGRALAPHA
jgi:hypothetical protein